MVVRIVILVFASAFLVPLLLYCGQDRPPRPYFDGMWSAQELDQAYSDAVASAHPRREKPKPGPLLFVAGLTRECLKHLPEYTGCNHQDILEAARVCAGGDRSTRVHDNRDHFPIKVGSDPNGHPISLIYDWDLRERTGQITFVYTGLASDAQCPQGGGPKRYGHWGEYSRCSLDHTKNCQGAAPSPPP